MKIFTNTFFVLVFLTVCARCTYQRPLFSIRVSSKESVDSITGQTKRAKNYNYWGFKKITRIGGYAKVIVLDSLGNKITTAYKKRNPINTIDQNFRVYSKVCYYSNSGKIEKKTKYIKQHSCLFSSVLVDKNIYYKNGKRQSKEISRDEKPAKLFKDN